MSEVEADAARYEVEQYFDDDLISYQEYQVCLAVIESEVSSA